MLDPSQLKQRAIEATGLSNFGSAPLDDGLEVLCRALIEQGALNEQAAAGTEKSLVGTLSERLRVEDWFARHPEILEQVAHNRLFDIEQRHQQVHRLKPLVAPVGCQLLRLLDRLLTLHRQLVGPKGHDVSPV